MSDKMSSPSDWVQFYQRALAGQVAPPVCGSSETMFSGRVFDATVVTTTVASASSPSLFGTGNPSGTSVYLNPEGRVSKPTRRRSRVSRRTPTTTLTTDTTNFRSMVQQFTGAPSAPFSSGIQIGTPNPSFGLGGRQHHLNTTTITVPLAYHLQQQQQQHQQQQQPQNYQQQQPQNYQQQQPQNYQQQQYMFSLNNTAGDVFLPRFSNSRPNLEISDGFVSESISSHVLPKSSSSNENRNNGFIS